MATSSISITLTGEAAERVERLVKSGDYPTAEAVVEDALGALNGALPELDGWLEEVATRYDEYKADPSQVISSAELRGLLFRNR